MVRERGLNSGVIFFVIKDHRFGNIAHDGRGQIRVFQIVDICNRHLIVVGETLFAFRQQILHVGIAGIVRCIQSDLRCFLRFILFKQGKRFLRFGVLKGSERLFVF